MVAGCAGNHVRIAIVGSICMACPWNPVDVSYTGQKRQSMSYPTSVLAQLLEALPHLRPQIYFKTSLTALSHAMEDQVLAGTEKPVVIACFQRERFYRQEAQRYRRIATKTNQVYVLAAPETHFKNASGIHETIAFEPTDALSHEWHLVVVAQTYATCLICREREGMTQILETGEMDGARRFEGIWTFDRRVACEAANLLLNRIQAYRPELAAKIQQARSLLSKVNPGLANVNPAPFADRLVTYLQASQYKLIKTYRSLAEQEQRERSINLMTTAIRRSLNPDEIFQVAAEEIGQALRVCRCLIYRCKKSDRTATISHEFLGLGVESLAGQTWLLTENPLFQEVVKTCEHIYIENAATDPRLQHPTIQESIRRANIGSWLLVPVLYQNQLVGMVELHDCGQCPREWTAQELALVEGITTQIGVALIQGEAFAHLESLNEQLEALDRTRSNLIAITGHELRTPLSTIQVCLESLASDPDMAPELRQVMLSTALDDADRMRKLVQDFLTLSRLESGRIEWHPEAMPLEECVYLSLSSISTRYAESQRPEIILEMPADLPLVRADGEWLVEVLTKLLDNACKFTPAEGTVTVSAKLINDRTLEVMVSDTGRGIASDLLEAVFDRFYQEEGALRRTTGGTGLGLAICRQIVTGWQGEIWATSPGLDQGSEFHFTIPLFVDQPDRRTTAEKKVSSKHSKAKKRRSQV